MIAATLRDALREAARIGGVAAFDADGTLWREDVGEAFLRHLVALGWVRLEDGRDPYQAYERAVELQPANPKALYGIGKILDRLNRPDEATAMYRRSREMSGR